MADELMVVMGDDVVLSALWDRPVGAEACLVLAHGAGAGMTHPFIEAVAGGLRDRGVATLRFQFPFMAAGSRRPDSPTVARAAVRAAIASAARLAPTLPLFAGGKSFGGRMTSQAQAIEASPAVRGLVFFGFPLHPAGKPSTARAAHLDDVRVPMLFLQGTRDGLADAALIGSVVEALGLNASLFAVEGADHGFHVLKRSGRTDEGALAAMLDATKAWIAEVLARA